MAEIVEFVGGGVPSDVVAAGDDGDVVVGSSGVNADDDAAAAVGSGGVDADASVVAEGCLLGVSLEALQMGT